MAARGDTAARGTSPASTGGRVGMASMATTKAVQIAADWQRQRPRRPPGPGRSPGRAACGAGCPPSSSGRAVEWHAGDGRCPARTAAEYPRQQLPVATGPPMGASGGDVVARRIFVHELDVRSESGAGEDRLRTGRGSAGCFRARGPPGPPRTCPRRRCPCRRTIPRRTGPGTRRTRRTRTGRCRRRRTRDADSESLRSRSVTKTRFVAAGSRSPRRRVRCARRSAAH